MLAIISFGDSLCYNVSITYYEKHYLIVPALHSRDALLPGSLEMYLKGMFTLNKISNWSSLIYFI